jgi:hypothetical protein
VVTNGEITKREWDIRNRFRIIWSCLILTKSLKSNALLIRRYLVF